MLKLHGCLDVHITLLVNIIVKESIWCTDGFIFVQNLKYSFILQKVDHLEG